MMFLSKQSTGYNKSKTKHVDNPCGISSEESQFQKKNAPSINAGRQEFRRKIGRLPFPGFYEDIPSPSSTYLRAREL